MIRRDLASQFQETEDVEGRLRYGIKALHAVERFVRLPVALLNDTDLSDSAMRTYAILMDVERNGIATISIDRIGERLGRGRTRYAAMAAIRQLVECGHVEVLKRGRSHVYRLVGCAGATNAVNGRPAIGCAVTRDRLLGDNPIGCAPATLRKRTYLNVLSKPNVRRAEREGAVARLHDQLVEALLAIGWTSEKIRSEAFTVLRDVGEANQVAFATLIRKHHLDPETLNPYGRALVDIRRPAA
jgi:hypothetical protein